MGTKNKAASPTADREIRMSREINARIELVWKVWTEPDHIRNWWGPHGFTNTISKMELIPGGEWNLVMHGPDGTDYRNESVFKEIIKHKRIVLEHVSGPKFIATIEFESRGNKTFLTWHMLFRTREEFVNTIRTFKADEGLIQNIEKLEEYLQHQQSTADRQLVVTRVLNAPRELVFEAWTKPEHLINWWGPNGFTNTFHEISVKKGGAWKFTMHGPNGKDYPNVVVYHEVVFPEKLVYAHGDPEDPAGDFITTVTFEDAGENKTKLTMTALLKSKEALQYVIREHGAVEGGKQTINKLEQYLSTLTQQ